MAGHNENMSRDEALPVYLQSILETIREPLVVLDSDLQVISANRVFYRKIQLAEDDVAGRRIYDLANGGVIFADLRNVLESILHETSEKARFENLEIEAGFPGAGRRTLKFNGRRIDQTGGNLILLAFEDVTDSIVNRRELEASEFRYAQLVENINSIIISLDADGIITYFNRFSERVFGYSRDEVIGKPCVGTLVPETDATGTNHSRLIEEIIANPEQYYINESVGLSRSGEEVWFSWSARVMRDDHGNVSEILIDGNDFTVERRQRINARQADQMVNNAPDPIARLDSSRTYVFVNAAFAEAAGRALDEIVGRKLGEIRLPGESVAGLSAAFDEVADTLTGRTYEADIDGRLFLVTIIPEVDDQNRLAFFNVFSRDISRRKAAEQKLRGEQERLRRSEEHFRSVLENSLDAGYRRDLRTDTYDYISPAIERITGLSADAFASLTIESVLERMHPDDTARIEDEMRSIMDNRENSGILEYRFRAENGEYVWLGDNFSIIRDANGEPLYRVGIVRDVTGAKQMEKELRVARNTAEKKVREAEEKERIIEAVFDNVPEGFAIFNSETNRVQVVSRYLADFAGMDRNEFLDLPIPEYARLLCATKVNGEPIPLQQMPIWRTMRHGELIVNENYRLTNSRGETITVLINTAPVRDAAGNVIRGIASWRNIEPMKKAEEALRASRDAARKAMRKAEERERILETILVSIPEGITVIEAPDGKLQLVSTYYENFIGVPAEKLFGMTLEERLDILKEFRPFGDGSPGKKENYPAWRALKNGEVILNEEWTLGIKDGDTAVVSVVAAPVRDNQGVITHAVMSWRNITDSKIMEAELRRNEYELRTLVESSPDLILRFDDKMHYVFVNSAYEHLTGIERDRFIGRTNKEMGMPQDQSDPWETDLKRVFRSGREKNIEFSFWGLFGKRHFWGRIIPEFDRNGRVETVMMVARDITERKQAEEHIRYVSFHDSVTGLYNRAYFEEEVGRLDSDRLLPVSFIMGDVNNLKLVNDTFGHHEGDRLLQSIAGILREACRDEDIIARWGGDEFAVILPDTGVETARAICSRIKEVAGKNDETVIRPSIALGAAAKTDADQNIYRIIMEAEAHMYDNKLAESRQNQELVISSLMARIREKWPEADQHVSRALELAHKFGQALGLSDSQMEDIDLMIRLHDIGKAVIPDDLLRKPGRLNRKEWETVKRHPEAGFRIVKTFAETARISDEILAQRERWDGTGYPRGLQGEQIPYLARVMSILDVYDVMTHERPYERVFSSNEAVDLIRQDAGKHFDPDLVEAFISTVDG